MNLQEFVTESLREIAAGVKDASSSNVNIGIQIAAAGKQEATCTAKDGRAGFLVDFDVAVTVTDKTSTEAGGGIQIVSISGGAKRVSGSEETSVSRIRFCVPIIYQ